MALASASPGGSSTAGEPGEDLNLPSLKRLRLNSGGTSPAVPGQLGPSGPGPKRGLAGGLATARRIERAEKNTELRKPHALPSVLAMAQVLATAGPRDPHLGAEYAAEGTRRLLMQERRCLPLSCYMSLQPDLTEQMRSMLVDWLVEVHGEYNLRRETLYLAVSLLDRYLRLSRGVARERLQLVGITALLVASKYEEVSPLEVKSAVDVTDCAYTAKEVLLTECGMLRTLDFEVACPTIAHFLPQLQAVSRIQRQLDFGLYSFFGSTTSGKVGELCDEMAWYLAELSLLDVKMVRFLPSHVAAAAILVSNRLFGRVPAWPQHLQDFTGLTEQALAGCALDLDRLQRAAPACNLQQVARKFPAVARIGHRPLCSA